MCLGVMALMIATSCNNQANEQNDDQRIADLCKDRDPGCKTCCYESDSRISKEAAWLWMQSWEVAQKAMDTTYTANKSPEFHFSLDSIRLIMPTIKDNTGVLLYYILKDESVKIPSLAMVFTENCAPQLEDCGEKCALVSWYSENKETTEQSFISNDNLQKYISNWKKYLDSVESYVRVQVDGYNYSSKLIELLSEDKKGITVKYGVRTLGPGEICEFEAVLDPFEPDIQPVLCNILIGWVDGVFGIRKFDELEEYDFARPCPTYCNSNN